MRLDTITIHNYRSFDRIEIPLCKDLTVLVGENNGGEGRARGYAQLMSEWHRLGKAQGI